MECTSTSCETIWTKTRFDSGRSPCLIKAEGKVTMENGKRIEILKMRVGDFKHDFGNPRKISAKKMEELETSMEMLGDFGIFLIDEHDNLIAGNQRAKVLMKKDPDTVVDVKRLVGYSKAELKSINIKDNTHAGEWDMDLLADWTSDLVVDLDVGEDKKKEPDDRKIPEMEPLHYEKYDYVMIACRSQLDYNDLVRKLGIENRKVLIAKTRKINARAIWYEDMKANLLSDKELEALKEAARKGEENE